MFSGEHLLEGTTSLFTPLSGDPERSSRRFLHKNKGSSSKNIVSPYSGICLQGSQTRTVILRISGRMRRIPKKPSKATAAPLTQDGFWQDTQYSGVQPG